MLIDWSRIREIHIKEACRRYDVGEEHPHRPAQNTFLLFDGKRYPAKFIRGLSYEIATGYKLNPNEYSGGTETVRFFSKLGFSTEYNEKSIKEIICTTPNIQQTLITCNRVTPIKPSLDAKNQKIALKEILKHRFGSIETEAKFDWLVVPELSSTDDVLTKIYDALISFRGYKNFFTSGRQLQCDFFIPSQNMVIEYDEWQHFTEPRAISLGLYPKNLSLALDIEYWKNECNTIKAKDSDKKTPFRDEQRAYYDSVRDILAVRNGIILIRIKHGDYDWNSETGKEMIDKILNTPMTKTWNSNGDKIIEQISSNYAKLQKKYRGWATKFKNHEDVINWLKDEKDIKEKYIKKCKKQDSFNLLSSNWNSITIPVLHKEAESDIKKMKDDFKKSFEDDLARYLLYFIHPVLHELYYFDKHYKNGYNSRLARLVRSHRQGLKATKTYLKEEGRTIDNFIKACSTTTFKHIYIHPTTSIWEKPNIQNIEESIRHLEIGKDCLSSDEKNIAMALSTMATKSFKRWIEYAQCAINEGPIFTLKENKKHSDCFNEIVKILQGTDQNQDIIRAKLEEYYIIEV